MTYDECLAVAAAELKIARQLIQDEIRDYPTPVSGCDAQYNHLVGQRSAISDALTALNELPIVATPRIQQPGQWAESR